MTSPEARGVSDADSDAALTVLHSTKHWLPATQTWLFHQVEQLADVDNHVVCDHKLNLDRFPAEHLYVSRDPVLGSPTLRRWSQRPLVGYPLRQWQRGWHARFVESVIKGCAASILHSHFGNRAWHDVRANRHTQVAHVVTFYGYDVGFLVRRFPIWRRRYEELFDEVDLVLCEGPHMACCVRELGCPPAKTRVHHLGIDVEQIPFRPRRWQKGEPLRVLMAASFRPKKGIPFGLRALGRLASQLDVQVTLVGDATEGNARSAREKADILQTISECGLEGRIDLVGFCSHDELFAHAYQHHVFLSPSVTASSGDTEGGAPVTIIEMAATGMPVVSTKHCDIPEVITHRQSGLLAPERDVDQLVELLLWLAEHPHEWEPMAQAARAHIEEEFCLHRQGERLEGIYRSLLGA